MYEYFEIAYALAADSLCLFLGTGFSKHITDGKAPSWIELLQACCDELDDPDSMKGVLFPGGKNDIPLEECAQIIELELKKQGKKLRFIIADIIGNLKIDDDKSETLKEFFEEHNNIKIITTNYDTLIEKFIVPGKCNSYCPAEIPLLIYPIAPTPAITGGNGAQRNSRPSEWRCSVPIIYTLLAMTANSLDLRSYEVPATSE